MNSSKTCNKKIHMLNARDNVILTVINKVNNSINMFEEINNEFNIFIDVLEKKELNTVSYREH